MIKSRPDVTFESPMPEWCRFDLAKACVAKDWLFMLPGKHAVDALRRGWEDFQQCHTLVNVNRTKIAETFVKSGMGSTLSSRDPAAVHWHGPTCAVGDVPDSAGECRRPDGGEAEGHPKGR